MRCQITDRECFEYIEKMIFISGKMRTTSIARMTMDVRGQKDYFVLIESCTTCSESIDGIFTTGFTSAS